MFDHQAMWKIANELEKLRKLFEKFLQVEEAAALQLSFKLGIPQLQQEITTLTRSIEQMSSTNFQLQDSQKVSYLLVAEDAAGLPAQLPAGATVSVASADPTLATVIPDATPAVGSVASGLIIAQPKLGTVQINATVTAADGTTVIATGSVAVDITSGALAKIAINLGTPQAQ